LVKREDAAVTPGDDSEMDCPFMCVMESLRRRLDRIDVTDEICNRHVGRCQLFTVAPCPWEPLDLCGVAPLGNEIYRVLADGMKGVVIDLAPLDNRDEFIQQAGECTYNAGLRLAAQPQK